MDGLKNIHNMKAKFLKIAGVKNEQEFYKKYPSEASFFKAHPEAKKMVDKAQGGKMVCPNGYKWDASVQRCVPYLGLSAGQPTLGGVGSGGDTAGYTWGSTPSITGQQQPVMKSPYETPPIMDINQTTVAGKEKSGFDFSKAMPYVQAGMDVIGGIGQIGAEKQAVAKAKQAAKVSEVEALAANSMVNQPEKRLYNRWEDMMFNPNQYGPSYGTAQTPSFATAEDGASVRRNMIGGTPSEIMNTFAPNTIYSDSGFEPLNDSDKVKRFDFGGDVSSFLTGPGGQYFQQMAGNIGTGGQGPSAGGSIGKGVGTAAGTAIGGPLGGMIGGTLGSLLGNVIDPTQRKIKQYQGQQSRNLASVMGAAQGAANRAMFAGSMENGGEVSDEYKWISHTWQPQTITHFGEHKVSDLLAPPKDADMLRTGGNIRQNYTYPSDYQMAMGGELQTTWGGSAQPISYNPFLPATGETVMFRGNSHEESDGKGHTGIGVKYGEGGKFMDYAEFGSRDADADVEVERNEPAIQLPDEDGGQSLVVYGNLKVPHYALSALGDPNAKGKTFKSYIADLSKKEQKQNNIIETHAEKLKQLNPITPNDILAFNTYKAKIEGANARLKEYATYKQNAAGIQNAINDTAKEHGLSAEHLAKGITKFEAPDESTGKYGKKITKAQPGKKIRSAYDLPNYRELEDPDYKPTSDNTPATTGAPATTSSVTPGHQLTQGEYNELVGLYDEAKKYKGKGSNEVVRRFQRRYHQLLPDVAIDISRKDPHGVTSFGKKNKLSNKELMGSTDVKNVLAKNNEDGIFGNRTEQYRAQLERLPKTDGTITPGTIEVPPTTGGKPSITKTTEIPPVKKKGLLDYLPMIASMIPRRPYQEGLDPMALIPEEYALSTNQLEPVQAQLLHPILKTPYDISYQDIINANQADFNAAQRMSGYNPAATASLAAQKYAANEKIYGEQTRQNMAQRMGIDAENIATLNNAQLENLKILDNQYVRQAQAKSKTKETTLAALSSIADKVAKNKLENRTFAAYSNLFPQYGFRGDMTAYSQAPTFFRTGVVPEGQSNLKPVYDKQGKNIVSYVSDSEDPTKKVKDGGKISKKDMKNSNVLKAYKNL